MTEPQQEMYVAERSAGELIDLPTTGTESTSAALRRVEQELVDAREEIRILRNSEGLEVVAAQAELASARAELDAVRTARDNLDRGVGQLRAQLLQLTQIPGEPADGVLASHVRYLCETCGARYGITYTDHEHGPLTPVLVTITRMSA